MVNPLESAEFSRNENPVRYLDDSTLRRPRTIPYKFRFIMAVFVLAAAILGGKVLLDVVDDVINAPKREVEATQHNLMRDIAFDVPVLTNVIQSDDASIMTSFHDLGYTFYEITSFEETEGNGFEIFKIPTDMSLEEASIYYTKGISSLRSSEAAKLLKGSWMMSVGRSGYLDMKVKYCDFDSGSVETAVTNGVAQQLLNESNLGESGVDSAGNTFQKGTVNVNGVDYNWQVSSCPLSEIYSVDGLPTTAAYVVVRMYL